MSHHIYHTDAIVLRSSPLREANKMLVLYTRELGLIYAQAQGIRLLKSKLRFALQDYSLARVDLVRGRDVWRVTSALANQSFGSIVRSETGIYFLHNITRLIERLAGGEEAHQALFDDVVIALRYLEKEGQEETFQVVELCLVLRILYYLGYIGNLDAHQGYVSGVFDPSLLNPKEIPRKSLIFEINRALRESQL